MYRSTSGEGVRERAARLGYRVVKSRDHPHPNNQGLYMLVENESDKPIYDIPAIPVCTGEELTQTS